MKTFLAAGLMTGLALLALPGPAAAETVTIPVTDLRGVTASGPIRIEITTGPQTGAVLEGSAASLERIKTKIEGHTLKVSVRCTFNCGSRDQLGVVLRVSAPILQAIEISKGAEASATGLNTSVLKLEASMGAALDVSGRCDTLEAEARMGGALDAGKLVCRDVTTTASMGGALEAHATQSVVAHASMGGTIDVAGNPARRDTGAAMGGMIDIN